MNVDNPLSQQFLIHHPVEAARVLEQLATSDVAALLTEIPVELSVNVLSAMLPGYAASCLNAMSAPDAAKFLNNVAVTHAARIYSLFSGERKKEIGALLASKHRKRIHRVLNYKSLSAGDLMNPDVDMLPDNLTVADAVRRIGKHRQGVKCEIYVVDNEHRLLGVIDLGKMLTARQQIHLGDIMNRSVPSVSVHASTNGLLSNKAWKGRQRLPVVENDNTLVGILDYAKLQETVDKDTSFNRDPMENLFSLAGLYWLSLVHLLDSVLNIAATRKGEG